MSRQLRHEWLANTIRSLIRTKPGRPVEDKQELLRWNREKWESKNRAMYAKGESNRWAWFNDGLDPDVAEFLETATDPIRDVLDLGTCSGSQAIGLARLGYSVIGSEVSETALEQARHRLGEMGSLDLEFVVDDIIESGFSNDRFDLVFDRGCYHSICCFAHDAYIRQLKRILRSGGILLLKVMSSRESRHIGSETIDGETVPMPSRFTIDTLQELFAKDFEVIDIRNSHFFSTVSDTPAKARLAILRNP
jgi:SAM-dependent methyltransferase